MNRFALAFLLCNTAALGQIGTSTITGRVSDASGAVVPNVSVVVVNTGTNFQFTAVTNADGLFRVQSLQPGPYRVTFEAAGFKRLIRDAVEVRASATRPVDAILEVGAVSESVEVKANSQLLETETGSSGALVIGSMYYKLPLLPAIGAIHADRHAGPATRELRLGGQREHALLTSPAHVRASSTFLRTPTSSAS